jgi:DNA replication protein DnaC
MISEYREKTKQILESAGADVTAMYRNLSQHFETHSASELSEADYQAMRFVDELERRLSLWREFTRVCGDRYAKCEFANFVVSQESQRKAVERLKATAKAMAGASHNIILYGGKGAGKDHLLSALARIAVLGHGMSVRWTTGPAMCCEFREPIQIRDVTDFEVIGRFASPRILYISDIAIPGAALTQHQSELLYEILDQRYRHSRPTWISANVAGQKQLSELIGAPHVDRLIDGATAIACDWESFRKKQGA